MHTVHIPRMQSAAGLLAAVFGVLSGLGGLLHAIGELLQGNVLTGGVFIESWTRGPIAEHMGGDPALTLLPTMLSTGIAALILSLALMVWSVFFVHRIHGGSIQLGLAVALLLCGGGVGPPSLGILAAFGGMGMRVADRPWATNLPVVLLDMLAGIWPWLFALTVLNGLFLIVGHIILVFFLGFTNAPVFLNSFFAAVLTLPPAIVSGIAYDVHRKARGRPQPV